VIAQFWFASYGGAGVVPMDPNASNSQQKGRDPEVWIKSWKQDRW